MISHTVALRLLVVLCLLACGRDVTRVETTSATPLVGVDIYGSAPEPDATAQDSPAGRPTSLANCPLEPCFASAALPVFDPRDAYRQRRVVHAATSAAPGVRSSGECASFGPDLVYELDLRGFQPPITVHVEARAEFDVSLIIEQGPSDDPFVVACNEDHATGVDNAFLAVTLAAERYRIVVGGENPADAGDFELSVELPPREVRCSLPPDNDRCEGAIPIDPSLPVQTLVGTTECSSDQAQPLWECGNYGLREGEVFYSLDLSKKSEPVLLHARTGLIPTDHDIHLLVLGDDAGSCSTTLACQGPAFLAEEPTTDLWALLDPGRYFLAVGHEGEAGEFGLRVELGGACEVSNDTCRTPTPLSTELGLQSHVVWPVCGDDSIATRCQIQSPTPDIFYRLDLSAFSGRVRVRASAEREFDSFGSVVLLEDEDGDCGRELWCGAFDLWLEPRSYLIALDGFRDQQGPVTLSVELATEPMPEQVDCIDMAVAQCAALQDYRCCSGDSEQCALALVGCGLRPEALACVCETDPTCCGTGETSYACDAVYLECGTFCEGFDPRLQCAQ